MRLLLICYDENTAYDRCECSSHVTYHTKYITNTFEQLCAVKSVKFELHPCHERHLSGVSHSHTEEAIDKLQAVINLHAKVEVEVYPPFGYEDDEDDNDANNENILETYNDERPLHGKWTREGGWVSK